MTAPEKFPDVAALLAAADRREPDEVKPPAMRLADFCTVLALQLTEKARAKAVAKRKGHVEYGRHVGTMVVELNALADALRKHAAAQGPCKAVRTDGAPCVRLGPHEAHTYDDGRRGALVEDVAPEGTPLALADGEPVCGIEDIYPTHDTSKTPPDRCLKPPHDTSEGHEGTWSKWPWQESPKVTHMAVVAHHADPIVPKVAETIAYLKGETDALGTEPLPFIEPRGEVQVSGPIELYSWGPTMTPLPALKFTTPGGTVMPPREPSGPDPFDDAVPEAPKRTGVWTGGALPVEPAPRPLWLGDPSSGGPALPTAIRTTAVRTGEQCGLQYRLVSRDQVPEVPSWANIGGSALHACAMRYESAVIEGMAAQVLDDATARAWWAHFFPLEISVTETESPFGRQHWRKADKGSEGEEWWNENGPLMVRDYSAWSAQMHADGWSILMVPSSNVPSMQPHIPPIPAMELPLRLPLPGMGELTGTLDQAWTRLSTPQGDQDVLWEIMVVDLKSGSRMPEDSWQLEAYPFGLRHRLTEAGLDLSACTWSAAYYDARNAKLCDPVTPRMDGSEIVYRASSVLRMHAANNYPANPGDTWKDPCYLCAVRYACPIMATRGL